MKLNAKGKPKVHLRGDAHPGNFCQHYLIRKVCSECVSAKRLKLVAKRKAKRDAKATQGGGE